MTHLGLFASKSQGEVTLALYTSWVDQTYSWGAPRDLVAQAPSTAITAGKMEIPVSPTALSPGKYWMVFSVAEEATVADEPSLFVTHFGTGLSFSTASYTYGAPMPAVFPVPGPPADDTDYNVFIRTQ